jgi:predicted alpha/beta hydrolase
VSAPAAAPTPVALDLRAADGAVLRGLLHEPPGAVRSHVLVAGGLGIAQRHYGAFAAPGRRARPSTVARCAVCRPTC